jgi:hypothetical protein
MQITISTLLSAVCLFICGTGQAALMTVDINGNEKNSFFVGEEIRINVSFSNPNSLPSNLTTSFQWGNPTGIFSNPDYGSSFEIVNWIGGSWGSYGSAPSTSVAFDFPGIYRILFSSQGSSYDYNTGYFRDYALGGQKDIQVTIPEPSALSLVAVGLGGLALLRRQRQ